jgi:GT2 family glycosyltransferase/glycosyltransferase involved in cell wall biosynthesis
MFEVCIDYPAEGYIADNIDFSIEGWAFCDNGIKKYSLYINGVLISNVVEKKQRKDVYDLYNKYSSALDSGFVMEVNASDLKLGMNLLSFEFHDDVGNFKKIEKTIKKEKPNFQYHNYYIELKKIEEKERKNNSMESNEIEFIFYITVSDINSLQLTLNSFFLQTYKNIKLRVLETEDSYGAYEVLKGFFQLDIEIFSDFKFDSNVDYVCFINSGEIFDRLAIENWAFYLKSDQPDFSYSDSDLFKKDGLHFAPNFKPDWSYEYFLSKDYVGGVYMLKNNKLYFETLRKVLFPLSPSYRYDIILKLLPYFEKIQHVQRLFWSSPYSETNEDLIESEYKSVVSHLNERGDGDIVEKKGSLRYVKRMLHSMPKVSIIIPTTGRIDLLVPCIDSLIEKTTYSNYELIFLDNGRNKHPEGIEYLKNKKLKVIERNEAFNWALLNNVGVDASDGELLLFMNDDIEITHENWLEELVAQAVRPEIGCVGGLLLYPDGNIQHAGVFLVDHGGGARHWLHFQNPNLDIYQDLHKVVREVSANTGACLMMKRSTFESVGGFDESLPIVGNDIDICLRFLEKGYKNIWTPHACMIHHESVSRKDVVYANDEIKMWEKWGHLYLSGDTFYNPYLTLEKSDCSFNLRKTQHNSIHENVIEKTSFGVNLIGYIKAEMGVGEGARGIARALDAANIPFCIINYEFGNPSRMGDNTWDHKIVSDPIYDINILHINADLTPQVVESLPKEYFKDKYTIGFWAWELPDFPDKWSSSFDLIDEVWCPSVFVKKSIEAKSSIPVNVYPHPIEKFNIPFLNRTYFNLPNDKFIFLSTYDIYSIQERKNPLGAIEAFKKAFKKNDPNVALVIKINNANEEEVKKLEKIVDNRKNVYFIRSEMSRYEMDSLIYQSDCFISLHRSEGFGLVLAESMALGTPVLATNWSGNVDFMNASNSLPVEYTLENLGQSFGPYEAYQYWANPSIDNAAQLMSMLLSSPNRTKEIISNGLHTSNTVLSPRSVGSAMKSRLNEISRKI